MSVEVPLDSPLPQAAEADTLSRVQAVLDASNQEVAAPEGQVEEPVSADPPLAEEPAEQTYSRKVKVRDGLELTVGELKDAYKTQAEHEGQTRKLIEERGNWQADQLRHERELTAILSAIDPQHVRPDLMQAYETRRKDYESRQRELVLRSIPEWSDAKVEQAEQAAIIEAIKPYGKTRTHFEEIPDAGWRRLLRDHVKMAEELKALKAKPVPKVAAAPVRHKAATPAQQWGREKAAVTSGRKSALAAVEKLVNDTLLNPKGGQQGRF